MRPGTVANRARLAIIVFAVGLLATVIVTVLVFQRARGQLGSSPAILYLFSYQIIALIFGLVLTILLVRWLLRPYRRMVEAARESPVRAATARSESEFVVETFQALIDQLQAKEKELERLHSIERNRAERSERFSERLIANIPSGLVTVDSRGTVSSANAQAIRIFGLAGTEGLNSGDAETGLISTALPFQSFFCHSASMTAFVRECLDTGSAFRREEVDVALPDGRVRRLGASISPIADSSHNIEGVLCLMTDITEVIELRERMKLKDNLANLGEMAAGIAHEFKNSLAAIHGYIQLLQTQLEASGYSAGTGDALEAALNEVRLLARVVTDFLNFARPQNLNLSPIDLRELITASVAEVESQLEESGIAIRIEGAFSTVLGDEHLLRRAFSNLLRNAIEAIDSQSAQKAITVEGSQDGGAEVRYAQIRITDTGRGISADDLPRIFIPFFTTKSRGYGIGLAIVQKILVAHGGDVTVEQSGSAGTTFRCRLPANAV